MPTTDEAGASGTKREWAMILGMLLVTPAVITINVIARIVNR